MRRLLLVEDDADRAAEVAERVGSEWTVQTSPDPESAALSAFASPPEAVVASIWTGGLSGLQLCQLLRGDPATTNVPVVLVTEAGDRRSRFWARRSGASALLRRDELTESLPEVLSRLCPADGDERPTITSEFDPSLRRSSIPGRLSMLLDRTLFEAVVVGELRSLALDAGDLDALFIALTRLLGDLVDYAWVALCVDGKGARRVRVHQSVAHGESALPDALGAVECTPSDEVKVVADKRPSRVAGEAKTVALPVALRGVRIGTLAVGTMRVGNALEERQVLQLTARELALPLHAVGLLEETRRLASTDWLTGLANRRKATEAVEALLARPDRADIAVAIVDVDHFKLINDTYGHAAGDRALSHVAELLRAHTRKHEVVARWGGEEFLMVLDEAPPAVAEAVADRMRAAVAAAPLVLDDGRSVAITVSVGVAPLGERERDLDRLLEAADRALYRAKTSGRDRVVVE
ncbi:MAG: GGDEF domain-containing response regulator [Polyangiales bacterium]